MNYNTINYKRMKFIISFLLVFFIGAFSSTAQTNMTKIQDGTIAGSSITPGLGVILELESSNKGFLTPRLSMQQRDGIAVSNRVDGLMIYNTTTGCFNYWSVAQTNWLSICGTPPPAVFTISTIQCNDVKVLGNYKQGNVLTSSNLMSIPVTVTQPGTYEIMVQTDNGYYFFASGTFPSEGNFTLILNGVGTPNNGYDAPAPGDVLNISLNNKPSTCSIYNFVAKAAVSYAADCSSVTILGNYFIGMLLDTTNKISLKVNVTSTGFWSIDTNTVNGYSFRNTGIFTATGIQTVELLGNGTPVVSGDNVFNLSTNSIVPSSCSAVTVNVKPIKYTVDCSQALISGIYKQDVPISSSNTVKIKVNVAATGQTSIVTNTVGGIYFTSGPLTFDALGEKEIILNAVGTPTIPGTHTYTLSSVPGMVGTCSFDVNTVAQPVSFNLDCNSLVVSGNYVPNISMIASNKIVLNANVQYPGAYTISSNIVDGITFSASGTFTNTGLQTVTLTASGTAITGGTHSFIITPSSGSSTNVCLIDIEFKYRLMNVLGLGTTMYQPGSAANSNSARAILQNKASFGPNGIINIEDLIIFDGANSQGTILRNAINTNKIDIIVMGYNYNATPESITVLADFVKNKKGVLLHSQELNTSSAIGLINAIAGGNTAVSLNNPTFTNTIKNVNDPILSGPFLDIRGKLTGSDVNNSLYATSFSSNLSNLISAAGDPSRSWLLKHNSLGYIFIGDSGWIAGTATNNSLDIWPAAITSNGAPLAKSYYGNTTVYNSFLYANIMSWAIKYVQSNTNATYVMP